MLEDKSEKIGITVCLDSESITLMIKLAKLKEISGSELISRLILKESKEYGLIESRGANNE